MKKIFLAAVLFSTAYAVRAQEMVSLRTTTTPTVDYTYQVPGTIRTNFVVTYPTATQVTWMPMSTDWWYAAYMNDESRMTRVYYNTQPYYLERNESFKVSLPVLNTYVPESVVASAIRTYGNDLFSITARKPGESGMQSYYITLIKNGVSEIVTMDGDNMAYTEVSKTPTGEITKTPSGEIVSTPIKNK